MGEFWYSKEVKETEREKRAILGALPAIFVGITMLSGLTIKQLIYG